MVGARRIRYLGIAICILFALGGRSPTVEQTAPNLNEIVAKFLDKTGSDFLYIGDNFIHEELEITDNFKDGILAEREEKLYIVKKDGGNFYRELVSKNGIPADNHRLELKKELVSINSRFLKRYFLVLRGEGAFEGKKCWILSFEPREGFPEERREDRVLNNLAGEIWIAQGTFGFAKCIFRLRNEVSFAWPFIVGGKVRKLEGVITADWIDDYSAVNFIQVEYEYSARAFFWPKSGHTVKTIHYQNYKRRNPQ